MMLPLQHAPVMADIAPAGADTAERIPYANNIYPATSEPGSKVNTQTVSYYERPTSSSTSTHLSSNEASQSSTWDYQRHAETPPSAVSNPSSQDQPSRFAQKVAHESNQRGTVSVRVLGPYPKNHPPPLDTNVSQRSVAHAIGHAEYLHGQKRTASGETKSGGASSPTSPIPTTPRRHAQRASISSNGSQIGELSAQLRTRLSYAMVKVQHGWQTRSISEVETLVSQNPSPISTTTTHALDSPLSTTATTTTHPFDSSLSTPTTTYPADRPTFAQSSERSTATPNYPHPALHLTTTPHTYPHPPPHHLYSPSHLSLPSTQSHPSTPSLAPPLDLHPRHPSRRSIPAFPAPPPSLTKPSSTPLSSTAAPSTPPPKRAPAYARTPSQKAKAKAKAKAAIEKEKEKEKEALEGLLEMSSPMRGGGVGGAGAKTTAERDWDREGFSSGEEEVGGRRGGGSRLVGERSGLGERLGLGVHVRERGGGGGGGASAARASAMRQGDDIDRLLDGMADARANGARDRELGWGAGGGESSSCSSCSGDGEDDGEDDGGGGGGAGAGADGLVAGSGSGGGGGSGSRSGSGRSFVNARA